MEPIGLKNRFNIKARKNWIYCREPSAEGLRKYDGVRTVQWKFYVAQGGAGTPQYI